MLDNIILYGFYTYGDNTEESDIDLMIVLNCDAKDVSKVRSSTAEMASDISLEQEVSLFILLRDKKHFEDNHNSLLFYQNILEMGLPSIQCGNLLFYYIPICIYVIGKK